MPPIVDGLGLAPHPAGQPLSWATSWGLDVERDDIEPATVARSANFENPPPHARDIKCTGGDNWLRSRSSGCSQRPLSGSGQIDVAHPHHEAIGSPPLPR